MKGNKKKNLPTNLIWLLSVFIIGLSLFFVLVKPKYKLVFLNQKMPFSFENYYLTQYQNGNNIVEIVYLPYSADDTTVGKSKQIKENSFGKYYFDTENIVNENPNIPNRSRHSLFTCDGSLSFELLTDDVRLTYNEIEKMLTDYALKHSPCFKK